ncbi:hypothetical protein M501DRAFT_1000138 [Patellaria atrata CBS 101060]|uniref:Uncharacterized protein n=1 Tax=Patellaria atrata CBS 101060 TaxID=1346257 RepID=A0A9P4VM02_9PEZI|nr:hypothetical protein M501DRAFT_1000138 [Patellaria atrata CBS 101060]
MVAFFQNFTHHISVFVLKTATTVVPKFSPFSKAFETNNRGIKVRTEISFPENHSSGTL